jgi:hypothetical protein
LLGPINLSNKTLESWGFGRGYEHELIEILRLASLERDEECKHLIRIECHDISQDCNDILLVFLLCQLNLFRNETKSSRFQELAVTSSMLLHTQSITKGNPFPLTRLVLVIVVSVSDKLFNDRLFKVCDISNSDTSYGYIFNVITCNGVYKLMSKENSMHVLYTFSLNLTLYVY